VLRLKKESGSGEHSIAGRVIFVRAEMTPTVSVIAIAYEGGSFGNSKRKNKVRLENLNMAGVRCAENLPVLYQFQLAGDLGALERQRGMIRQQLLEQLHRALIGGTNFDSFD
jgi:hypothetical protein